MHLKEVHMENFKSFGRKLVVPFEPGFTAITGPNGSGKSNIGDAVLFVLGPNSPRAIRAGRLTDLIFNGGEHGHAAKQCQVSLVFDNEDRTMPVDADEVVLTRKVTRKPRKDDPEAYSSYFYVNGRASQKREFVDLLNHARISADGYNITQQGDVLQICQMSNVQRRQILDDIAGVTAFDGDIAKADRRRGEVEENLDRIGIVLEEIERSLATLEKEKESAQKYQDLQNEIGATKGRMAWRRRVDLETQISQVQEQIAGFARERASLEERLQGMKGTYKEAQARFAEAEQRIREEGGEEVQELQERLEKARDAMVRLEEKINYAKGELQGGKEELLPLKDELRRVGKEKERTARLLEEAGQEAEEASTELAARREEMDGLRDLISRSDEGSMQLHRELARLKQEHEQLQLEHHEARLETDRLQDRLAAAEKAHAEAQRGLEALVQDLEETAWQAKELRQTTDGSGKKRKELERRLFELRKAQAEMARQSEDLENRIRRLRREQIELQAEVDAAARAGHGASRAVEELLKARDAGKIQGIVGTIAELASVEDRYQTALETAAGASMQAVVVEDDGVAAKCIELLKGARAGRAKLFPLNKMVPGRPRGQALMKVNQEGCLGFALDLVEFNPRYQNAFWHAFGDTLVVDAMNTGRRLMGGVRIVSLDGELFEAGGAMVGGSRGKKRDGPGFANLDRGRIDGLLHEIQEAESAQESVLERLAGVREETAKLQDEMDAQGRGDAGSGDRLKDLERRETQLRERQASEEAERDRLATEAQKLREALAEHLQRCSALETRLEELETQRQEKGALLLKGSKKEWRERMQALEEEVRRLHEGVLSAQSRRDVAAKQLELVDERLAEVQQRLDGHDAQQARHQEDLERHTAAHQKARAEVDALMEMERKATSALKGLREERDRLYGELTDLKAKMDKVADRMETHHGLITNAKAKLPALEESFGEAMVELKEHGFEPEEGEEVAAYDDLRRRLRDLEARLGRLGPVNMRALEEYDAADARRTSLKEEVDRLENQRTELVRLVEEIQQKKKDALMEVFTEINRNFAEVYARLSLGGKALMELENEDDPFSGGLVLKAQPMGKRVTRLDALSGGEKGLTSMAFIFAIQMFDPSPFYYLDEVDQNLDAINSELLARLVRDNSRFAQFIVVSLRKITLKEASHIYGVTQQTPGRSEVIANFDIQQLPDPDDGEDGDEDGGQMVLRRKGGDEDGEGPGKGGSNGQGGKNGKNGKDGGHGGQETLSEAIGNLVGIKAEA